MTTTSNQVPNSRSAPYSGPAGKRPARRLPARRFAALVAVYLILLGGALLMLVPFIFSVMTSLKTPGQFATTAPLTVPNPATGENFAALFAPSVSFWTPIAVTAQVVVVMVLGQLFASILAAYAFATLRFPGREPLFWVYLSTMMVPQVVTIIPLYVMVSQAGYKNTFWGLVVPLMFGSPYAIFLLRENFRAVPAEIVDAARLDGAGYLQRLVRVMLPMCKPIVVTLILITVVSHWNNFMWPSVIANNPEWRVITVATSALQTQYSGNWTLVMAATTLALAPLIILFLAFQNQITRSLGVTGMR